MKWWRYPWRSWQTLAVGAVSALLLVAEPTVMHTRWFVGTLHPRRAPVDAVAAAGARLYLGTLEEVAFETVDGLTLKGWYTPSRSGAVVIFVHGGFGNRTHFLPEAGELVKRGIGVLLFDSRASGESGGDMMTWGDREQWDLDGALDFVAARPDVDASRIGVQGFSIGASTVALVAAKDKRVSAVLLNAVWTDLADEIRYKTRHSRSLTSWGILKGMQMQGVDFAHVRPIDHIQEIAPRPLLMIGSTGDADTPPEIFAQVYAAAKSPKQIWMVPDAPHGAYAEYGGERYLKRVVQFFETSLLERESAAE